MITEIILTILGVCFIIGGLIKIRDNNYLKSSGIKVKGIVYSLEQRKNLYYPIVRFRTKEDIWITKELGIGSNPSHYPEGTQVDLIYNPENPEIVDLDSYTSLILAPRLFVIIGTGLIAYIFLSLFDMI
ncbi:DUF3592 domain-containing protein [Adhaeribacter rhizoryzae]|uniref:DUF3592 domain-containing protein n=1 Tax=Adhaeribacter rhizoryzae TaxID=2607907 RepID=A0A5M6DAP9_9BACT|nr:DUF3592 domain-containing protein [Adhaeribacter rhizoryzae]KAA5543372.1 DUF3592 domain-containing protein [Adhaeribacter rhizoryzae]